MGSLLLLSDLLEISLLDIYFKGQKRLLKVIKGIFFGANQFQRTDLWPTYEPVSQGAQQNRPGAECRTASRRLGKIFRGVEGGGQVIAGDGGSADDRRRLCIEVHWGQAIGTPRQDEGSGARDSSITRIVCPSVGPTAMGKHYERR